MTKLLSLLNSFVNFLENDIPYFLGRKDIFHETRLDDLNDRITNLENKLYNLERKDELIKLNKSQNR